jgi:hypothetical protein
MVLSLTGGADRVVAGAAGEPSRPAGEGRHSHVEASWLYARPGRAASLTISGHSAARYFPDVGSTLVASHGVGVTGSWRPGRRTTIDASHRVSYSPLSLFGAFDSLATPGSEAPTIDEGLFTRMTLRHGGTIRASRVLDRRASVAIGYEYTAGDARDGAAVGSQFAFAQVRRNLSPGASLRLGYGAGTARLGSSTSGALHHHLDVGLDYARPMPFSRRTTVALRTGSVVLTGDTTDLRLDVSASARHPVGRDWRVQLTYDRPMEFVEGFAEPLLSDALTAGVDGRLWRRAVVGAAVSMTEGSVGAGFRGRRFRSHGVLTRLRFPLRRHWMLTAEYIDFQYQFSEGIALPGRVPRELRRRALRGGVAWTFGSSSHTD